MTLLGTGTVGTCTCTDGICTRTECTDTAIVSIGTSIDSIYTCSANTGTSSDGIDLTRPYEVTVNDADVPCTSPDSTGGTGPVLLAVLVDT